MKNEPGTYQIKNLVNGKVYYGSSCNLANRLAQHRSHLRGSYHSNKRLQASWNKHGEDAFVFEVIEYASSHAQALEEEQLLLDCYWDNCKRCYNIAKVAMSPMKGRKHSEESKRLISESNKGRVVTQDTRDKISEAVTGYEHSDEAKAKMSKAHTGKALSVEHSRKISEALKGKKKPPRSDEHKRNLGDAMRGKKQSKVTCPHCGKTGGSSNMKRWHFANCKLKSNLTQ